MIFDLISVLQIKQILLEYNLRPLKSLGQHFLIDSRVKNLFLKFADIKKSDIIVEVGPGLGALTFEIAKYAGKVLAIEKDKKLAEILKAAAPKNVEIISGDVLRLDIGGLLPKKYKLISDVPYNIASPLLELFLENPSSDSGSDGVRPKLAVLMLQRELADKIMAQPPRASRIGVVVQSLCEIKKISDVSPSSFWPMPEVWSSLILLKLRNLSLLNKKTLEIVKKCFTFKRKKLLKTLTEILKINPTEVEKIFIDNNIDINARPENLSIQDWKKIESFTI